MGGEEAEESRLTHWCGGLASISRHSDRQQRRRQSAAGAFLKPSEPSPGAGGSAAFGDAGGFLPPSADCQHASGREVNWQNIASIVNRRKSIC